MRGLTAAGIAAAVIVVIAAALYLRRGDTVSEAPPPQAAAPRAQPKAPKNMERSARVEERLNELRNDFDHKLGSAANPAPNKREVPTVASKHRDMEASKDQDDLDAEDPDEMNQLKQTLLTNPDPDERIGAVLMLTGEEGPDSLHMLMDAINDPDPEVRLAAVEALGDRAEELSPAALAGPMSDPDAEVRFEAVSILGDMETPEAMQMVRAAKQDPDEDVRALAEGIDDFADDEEDNTLPTPGPTAHR
jgi:hypothetical protein